MMLPILVLCLIMGCIHSAPAPASAAPSAKADWDSDVQSKDDLTGAASSSHTRRYSDWQGYHNGVTGYGILDDRYNSYIGQGVYDTSLGYGGYNGYSGYNRGYSGYNSGYSGQNGGYGGYKGISGSGGYGGYGGNGGLNSYYGYNNPYYNGANNLGYGYNKRGGFYGSITPSLVTGYRGYSR